MSAATEKLSVEQAVRYWAQAAGNLETMLAQYDAATPALGSLEGLGEELRETLTAHLVGAKAMVGHYSLILSGQHAQSRATSGQATGSHVPPARQAAMPGYAAPQPGLAEARTW